jgi:hypothetical protein
MKRQREFVANKKQSFSFSCNKCQKQQPGELNTTKNGVLCTVCKTDMKVSPFMLKALVDISADKPKA